MTLAFISVLLLTSKFSEISKSTGVVNHLNVVCFLYNNVAFGFLQCGSLSSGYLSWWNFGYSIIMALGTVAYAFESLSRGLVASMGIFASLLVFIRASMTPVRESMEGNDATCAISTLSYVTCSFALLIKLLNELVNVSRGSSRPCKENLIWTQMANAPLLT